MLERYEPSGKRRNIDGADGAVVKIVGEYDEQDVMRRIFTGLCATWGLEDYDPSKASKNLVNATIILGLSGHFWVGQQFEALNVTFSFVNVSRGFTHQLVRSRFMAFGQEGTRDTNQENFDVSIPESIASNANLRDWYIGIMEASRDFIREAHAYGVPFQDSSYITPKGLLTDIVCHVNYRALQEFMSARLSNTMHWEINRVAKMMRQQFLLAFPTFGLWLVPRCEIVGKCQSSATLFPPCGKFPLREGQSAEVNRFGVPYMHGIESNPTSADPIDVGDDRTYADDMKAGRDEFVRWALDVFDRNKQKELFDAATIRREV